MDQSTTSRLTLSRRSMLGTAAAAAGAGLTTQLTSARAWAAPGGPGPVLLAQLGDGALVGLVGTEGAQRLVRYDRSGAAASRGRYVAGRTLLTLPPAERVERLTPAGGVVRTGGARPVVWRERTFEAGPTQAWPEGATVPGETHGRGRVVVRDSGTIAVTRHVSAGGAASPVDVAAFRGFRESRVVDLAADGTLLVLHGQYADTPYLDTLSRVAADGTVLSSATVDNADDLTAPLAPVPGEGWQNGGGALVRIDRGNRPSTTAQVQSDGSLVVEEA